MGAAGEEAEMRGMTRLATVAGCCAACLGTAGAAEARYDFRFTPRVAKKTSQVDVSFRAPYSENRDEWYVLDVYGPPGCPEASEVTQTSVQAGKRIRFRLGPGDLSLPGPRRTWCPGRYVGNVQFIWKNGDSSFIGWVGFRVR